MINDILNGVSSFLNGTVRDIFTGLTTFFFHLILNLVNLVLEPLNYILETTIPGFSVITDYVGAFFTWLSDLIPWAVSYLGLDPALLNIIVVFITFRLTVTLSINVIKFSLNWYRSLK